MNKYENLMLKKNFRINYSTRGYQICFQHIPVVTIGEYRTCYEQRFLMNYDNYDCYCGDNFKEGNQLLDEILNGETTKYNGVIYKAMDECMERQRNRLNKFIVNGDMKRKVWKYPNQVYVKVKSNCEKGFFKQGRLRWNDFDDSI